MIMKKIVPPMIFYQNRHCSPVYVSYIYNAVKTMNLIDLNVRLCKFQVINSGLLKSMVKNRFKY